MERDLPWKLTGFDIHLRVSWRWPFWKCHVGKVWNIKPTKIKLSDGAEATISERSELPPGI